MPDEFLSRLSIDERVTLWEGILARPIRPRAARFVSEGEGKEVAGFIIVGPAEGDPETDTGEVYTLNVDPDFWGRGHGGALLAAGVEALGQAGFAQAVLWVHSGAERSRRFYEHNAWLPDGVERTVDLLGAVVPETRYRHLVGA